MKKVLLISTFILSVLSINAQNKNTKLADKLYDSYEYLNASKEYLKLAESNKADTYVYKKLGDCYYNIFNSKEAVKWYAKADVDNNQDAEFYFKYGQMLKAEGNANSSAVQFEKFVNLKPNDDRAKDYKLITEKENQINSQKKKYDISKTSFNSENFEYSAVLTQNNEVYFTSSRNKTKKTHGMDNQPYLDIYKASMNEDGSYTLATDVAELNSKWHDGGITITKDGNTAYFSSSSFNDSKFEKVKNNKLKVGKMFLYQATKDANGKWGNIKPLSINSVDFNLRNPSISADGKTLYYSSDKTGGLGGEDIYFSTVDGENVGIPQNVGENVNTAGQEGFPTITEDNVLFFSSNGRAGLGALDVFYSENAGKSPSINAGAPVNSNKDDFSFSYNTSKDKGFFSSNRDGNDDVFQAVAVCGVNALVVVKDKMTGGVLPNANVTVSNSQKTFGTRTTNSNGLASFELPCNEEFGVAVSANGFESGTGNIEKSRNGETSLVVFLEPVKAIVTEKEVILQPIYFEYDKSNITEQGARELDKLVAVMNEYPNMVIDARSHTDSRGNDNYNLSLSDRRAKATVQYVISKGIAAERIFGKGYGETLPKVTCTECTEEEHAQNRRSEFLIVKK
jgi:outer membrane protein OmpA-like peptidoglycan-associated protein/tetratricopeptide (TPR) repeat protein